MGFANLPNQVYRKSVKRGFEFTLMVVGKLSQCVSVSVSVSLFVCACPLASAHVIVHLCLSESAHLDVCLRPLVHQHCANLNHQRRLVGRREGMCGTMAASAARGDELTILKMGPCKATVA